MKSLAQSLTVSAAIYSILFILLASMAFGAETSQNLSADSVSTETEYYFNDEEYVDDIPFDTQSIAENYLFESSMNVTFDFEEEAYVDDIPFNTNMIAHKQTENMVLAK